MPFKITLRPDNVVISDGEEELILVPAEVEKARNAVSTALGMSALKVLPSHIKVSPFKVQFNSNESGITCKLVRELDGPGVQLETGLNQLLDSQRLTGGPRPTVSAVDYVEPIIDGRD
jgi:hypothetical protein